METELIKYHIYKWKGKDADGKSVRGQTPARTVDDLESDLSTEGVTIENSKEIPNFLVSKKLRAKIKPNDIMVFFRQLATMIKSGIPLVKSLEIVSSGLENANLLELIMTIHRDVSSGDTFTLALKKHPKYFNDLTCNLVKVGEESGTLDTLLIRIAEHLEKMQSIKNRVKKALFYPTLILIIAGVVSFLLLFFIVPRFQNLFASFGADLPGPTQVVINLSKFLQAYWWMILLGAIAFIVSFRLARRRSKKFNEFLAKASLKIFVFGPLLRKAAVANITRTLSISLNAGIPLVTALEFVAKVAGNIVYERAVLKMRDEIITGKQLQDAIRSSKLFPTMVLQMLIVGEQSGEMETMLGKVADFYEEQVDVAVDGLSSLIEPLIIVVLGVVIGGFVVSMYLPIFKLGTIL